MHLSYRNLVFMHLRARAGETGSGEIGERALNSGMMQPVASNRVRAPQRRSKRVFVIMIPNARSHQTGQY